MGFRINTNIGAMNAHNNAMQNNLGLDKSLNALSSGLRINNAADDASGMTIADSLRSQSQGLGQSIRNANDGISVTQTADGALKEYIKIINTVRTKAIQSASDGQNADSRGAIQKDINRLLQEANNIAKTTQFNGQKLLDGNFSNKSFHIGAYADETVDLSVKKTQIDSVGAIKSTEQNSTIGTTSLSGGSGNTNITRAKNGSWRLTSDFMKINNTDVTSTLIGNSPNKILDAKNIADAITKATGITTTAETTQGSSAAVEAVSIAGTASSHIKINGVNIGAVSVSGADGNKALALAINAVSVETGVTADTNASGILSLKAADGRNISVDITDAESQKVHLADTTTTVSGAQVNNLKSASSGQVIIKVGELVVNGVDMHGTYGDGSTKGKAREDLQAALQKIDGLSATTITTDGKIQLKSNDGTDINAAGDNSTYIDNAQQGISNDATHGVVKIFSDINLQTDITTSGVIGLAQGTMRTELGDEHLDSIDVTSRKSAELAISITDKRKSM